MFAATSLALVVLAAVGLSAEPLYYDGITINQFADSVRKEASEQCLRRSSIALDTIDPLYLDTFTVKNGDFIVKNKNAVVTGLGNAVLSNIKWSFDKKVTTAQASANVTLTSDYETSGKFLFLPMSGSGKLNVYGYDLKANVSFSFRKVLINSVEYLEIYDFKTEQNFGLLQFDLKSDGTCATVDTLANAALNANWRLLEPVGSAEAGKVIDQKVEVELNKVFRKVPYDELVKYVQQ